MLDEGYIKFKANWRKKPAFSDSRIIVLNQARQILYQNNLIGAYAGGVGFGNVSQRVNNGIIGNSFLITGAATGNFPILTSEHFSLVTKVDIPQNTLSCEGPIIASSESMSHAVVYEECPDIEAVVHVHSLELWKDLLWKIPTTHEAATYGSPEMANSIVDLLKNTDLRYTKLFIMSGHEEGIFSFGKTMEEAVDIVINL